MINTLKNIPEVTNFFMQQKSTQVWLVDDMCTHRKASLSSSDHGTVGPIIVSQGSEIFITSQRVLQKLNKINDSGEF